MSTRRRSFGGSMKNTFFFFFLSENFRFLEMEFSVCLSGCVFVMVCGSH